MKTVKVFTDRYPLLGPLIWIATIEYFITQIIVAAAWSRPSYSWFFNTISDLGATTCGHAGSRLVCSPQHSLMNASFVSLGILMALGSLLIYQEFRESSGTRIGFSLMALSGLGTLMVGLFPENTVPALHTIGASLPFLLGNIGLVVLGRVLYGMNYTFKVYTLMSGLVSLGALLLFITHNYLGLGIGGMERVVAYPQTVWLIFFGLYLSKNHYQSKRQIH